MLMYYVGALLCATSKLNYKWKRKSDFLYVFDPNKCMFLFGGGLNKFVDKCRPPWLGDKEVLYRLKRPYWAGYSPPSPPATSWLT